MKPSQGDSRFGEQSEGGPSSCGIPSQSSGSAGQFKEDLDPITSGHTRLLNLAQVSCCLSDRKLPLA